jgi:excisionase family DNA binding protein
VSIAEAAEHLGMSYSGVRAVIMRGELRAYRVGAKFIRVRKADLLKYAKDRVEAVG